ncbi:MAG: hypothetical protein EZS28_049357, partial [Streblomastix strix]
IAESEGTSMNSELMEEFLSEFFVPKVEETRKRLGVAANERAILLMDNLRAHCTALNLTYLAVNNIIVITPPPHATHLLQAADLGIFGPFKTHMQTLRCNHVHDSQEFLIGIALSAMRQATTAINVRAGFLAGALKEIENNKGNLVAQFVQESIEAAIKTAEDDGILLKEAPTRITNFRAPDPWGFVNYDQFMGFM